MTFLPRPIEKVGVSPIKCQGIKTKLVDFIARNLRWDGKGRWIEPFLGSGVVLFNLRPERALVSDTNAHLIRFYREIQSGRIDENLVRDYLEEAGEALRARGEACYYEVRDRFNRKGESLDLLFLNRSCFNGVMRFNSKGLYNVPFGHKPDRFRKPYVTKIRNQVRWVREVLSGRDWRFEIRDWRETLQEAEEGDFLYLDPPYIGRHTEYGGRWTEEEAAELARAAERSPCGFALSMWKENRYRANPHIAQYWQDCEVRTFSHFYHVGSRETLRGGMEEALVIRRGHAAEAGPSAGD